MTNLDRIREMSAEELAVFLEGFDRCIVCQIVCTREHRCVKGITAWLKKEVKNDDER